MKDIESYNSSYPLDYFKTVTIYSFYGKAYAKGTPATSEAIRKYASILNRLVVEEQERTNKSVKGFNKAGSCLDCLTCFYAVVIEKVKSDSNAYIVVMLCNKYNGRTEYYTKKYSVNHGCATDGKDLMPLSAYLDFKSN